MPSVDRGTDEKEEEEEEVLTQSPKRKVGRRGTTTASRSLPTEVRQQQEENKNETDDDDDEDDDDDKNGYPRINRLAYDLDSTDIDKLPLPSIEVIKENCSLFNRNSAPSPPPRICSNLPSSTRSRKRSGVT